MVTVLSQEDELISKLRRPPEHAETERLIQQKKLDSRVRVLLPSDCFPPPFHPRVENFSAVSSGCSYITLF